MCGSGMQAAIMAARHARRRLGRRDRRRRHGEHDQRALSQRRSTAAAPASATTRLVRPYVLDGLEDAYEPGRLMGSFAEESARDYQFTRERRTIMRSRA
jgi:acetyl-CoA C-acetyltransferase